MIRSLLRLTTALVFVLNAGVALAHFPILDCERSGTERLRCFAQFSDGGVADRQELRLFGYDDKLRASYTTLSDGTVEIPLPKGEYYIVFDPGHDTAAEFDYAEVK
jgi:hypothetical protein